ncbi:MAG: carboxypeptidase regulatory-like domain-containing protein [Chthoniobacter sp.]|uniref:carboxypeptidase regulatory-like domain-containing protein n=1 Tax=Chthoniobacter sp. TaxID=2510640 RepID=UPI0032ACEDA2
MSPPRVFFLLFLVVAACPPAAHAWGPHPEITQAAVDTLGADDALVRRLGAETAKLREYCWMADWRRQLRRETRGWFYTDDYLLFPPMTTHRDHLCPDVKQTYEPFFRRALQALRTETPWNAARWIGSIMHFTEDTGSPPHAAEIRGDVHSKMENWVDAKAITLAGYRPQLLGKTDDEAVAGFLKRMDGLIEFSKVRAERAKPFVVSGDRAATEPIVLESALETSRVVADLLFTLGTLADQTPDGGATLRGTVTSAAPAGLEALAAKIVLPGTNFSTLADAEGCYEFRNLPSGSYLVAVLRAGSAIARAEVALSPGQILTHDFALTADSVAGNMIRNSSFAALWLSPAQPDAWCPVKSRTAGPHWEGELLPLRAGTTYRLKVAWEKAAKGRVVVRLRKSADISQFPTELKPLQPGETELDFPATGDTALAQVLIFTEGAPSSACRHISLSPLP